MATTRAWRDHHRYERWDMAELIELQRQHSAEAFLTTEKDWVRLSPVQRKTLENAAPLHVAKLVVRLLDEPAAVEQLLGLLPANVRERAPELRQAP